MMKIMRQDATGQIYAETAKPSLTVRFKQTSGVKNIDGVSLQNNVAEIIVNDSNVLTIGTKSLKDPLSVRIKVSGSAESAARKKVLVKAIAAQLDEWADEDVYEGFPPSTVPVITV